MKRIATVDQTKFILEHYGVRPLKRLGQNFLVQPEVPERISSGYSISPLDTVVEIGPGLGALTEYLVEKSSKVVAIELDHGLAKMLPLSIPSPKLLVVDGDALKININQYIEPEQPVVLFSNLPYYITTDIVMHVLTNWRIHLKAIILLVQKEVAIKWSQKKLDTEATSNEIIIRGLTDIELLFHVSHHAFYPKPDVHSAVVKLVPKSDYQSSLSALPLIQSAYSMKRKTIVSSLSSLGYDKEKLLHFIEINKLNADIRPNDLSFDQWLQLAKFMKE